MDAAVSGASLADIAFPAPVRTSDTLVFAPTYNERGNIERLLDGLAAAAPGAVILIVDDGSGDGTRDQLAARRRVNRRLGVIARPGKLGIGSAHKLGWLHARRLGYGRIATMDADLSHDPADVPRLLAALDGGADVALGSRYIAGGRIDYTGWRLFLSRTANSLAHRALGTRVSEFTTSLRAARLDRVPAGLVETIDNDGYGFFLACVTRFARAGLGIVEVPIHFRDRQHGQSKIPRLEILRGGANLARLALQRGPWRPTSGGIGDGAPCPDCGRSYRIPLPDGGIRCLACFGRGGAGAAPAEG
jgi:dolichol-phosphate mannosyltransferase